MQLIPDRSAMEIVSTHTDLKRINGSMAHRSRRVRRTKRRIAPSRSASGNKVFVSRRRSTADNRLQPQARRETASLDDDGFESLNGNASSENGDEGNQAVAGGVVKRSSVSDRSALNWQPGERPNPDFQEAVAPGGHEGNYRQVWVEEVLRKRLSSPIDSSLLRRCSLHTPPSDVNNIVPGLHVLPSSDQGSDDEDDTPPPLPPPLLPPPSLAPESSYNSSCDSEEVGEGGVSTGEWPGVTTNSDDCSYSSDDLLGGPTAADGDPDTLNDHPFAWEFGLSPSVMLTPSCAASDRVSCTMWERRDAKKADLSVLDISSAIIARVETMPNDVDYFYGGFLLSVGLSLMPPLCRLAPFTVEDALHSEAIEHPSFANVSITLGSLLDTMLGSHGWERAIIVVALLERFLLACLFFFLLAVAERTFKQRFLFAKLFSQLTSSRRARKSDLPHFRLNKVRNIKTWLSVRSYLKRRGPQRSVDVIVSTAFITALALLSFLSVECLKDSPRIHTQYILEALVWCLGLGVFLLRFMTLGTKINRKYRNLSVLITEQINLYLQIEQKPHKKDELMVANSVLKLAADLLKELECPFKISGLSANPYLYTITKVVILSALSGVLSEILGFKLKLHKIKIK